MVPISDSIKVFVIRNENFKCKIFKKLAAVGATGAPLCRIKSPPPSHPPRSIVCSHPPARHRAGLKQASRSRRTARSQSPEIDIRPRFCWHSRSLLQHTSRCTAAAAHINIRGRAPSRFAEIFHFFPPTQRTRLRAPDASSGRASGSRFRDEVCGGHGGCEAGAARRPARGRVLRSMRRTAGVVSGLGKGVTASSVGVLFKAAGYRVSCIKIGEFCFDISRLRRPQNAAPSPSSCAVSWGSILYLRIGSLHAGSLGGAWGLGDLKHSKICGCMSNTQTRAPPSAARPVPQHRCGHHVALRARRSVCPG